MIIACPECAQPFELEDGDISALVQLECPHCSFRMILDFEAANDASLIEPAMRMAQGWSSEADYRIAVGAGTISTGAAPVSPRPRLEPVTEPVAEPAKPEPEPARVEPAARIVEPARLPPTQPAPEKPAAVQPTVEPARVAAEAEPAEAKPPVRMQREARARPTLIAHTAPPPAPLPEAQAPEPARTEPQPPEPPRVEPEAEVDVDFDLSEPATESMTAEPARHTPPRTAPASVPVRHEPPPEPPAKVSPAAESQSRPVPKQLAEPEPPPAEAIDDDLDDEFEKTSGFVTFLKVILLLILLSVAGLMVWSLIETNDPNPLPFLRERYGLPF